MCRWEERRRCSLAAVRSAVRRAVGSLAQIAMMGAGRRRSIVVLSVLTSLLMWRCLRMCWWNERDGMRLWRVAVFESMCNWRKPVMDEVMLRRCFGLWRRRLGSRSSTARAGRWPRWLQPSRCCCDGVWGGRHGLKSVNWWCMKWGTSRPKRPALQWQKVGLNVTFTQDTNLLPSKKWSQEGCLPRTDVPIVFRWSNRGIPIDHGWWAFLLEEPLTKF